MTLKLPPHLVFLLLTLAFLSGVAFASLGLSFLYSLAPAAILFAILLFLKIDARLALVSAVILLAGSFYYFSDDHRYQEQLSKLPKTGEIQGLIVSDPRQGQSFQSFYLKTNFGKILVETDFNAVYSYGDALIAAGKIEKPPPTGYGRYLAEEKVAGIMNNPRITIVSSGGGNRLLAFLFNVKHGIKESFAKVLAPEQSALLFGIIFGSTENFPNRLLQNLSLSGTRFITAIDGLHMQIVILIILGAFTYFLPRKPAFAATFVFVFLFIALTGFTASGIRAALMAFIAGLAKEIGRRHAIYNAIALAALVLALINPKVLLFDVGFQLSFIAVLSIIYFTPVIKYLLKISDEEWFMNLKQSLLITAAVQIATAPIAIAQFQSFSLTSFIASALVVLVLPFIMTLGLLIALFSFFLQPLALVISFVAGPLIDYTTFIVNLFAKFAVLFNPRLGFTGVLIYYGFLIFLMYKFYEPAIKNISSKEK